MNINGEEQASDSARMLVESLRKQRDDLAQTFPKVDPMVLDEGRTRIDAALASAEKLLATLIRKPHQ